MARSLHRAGARWQQARARMFATYGEVCVICGHEGAREAGHLDALALNPHQAIDYTRLRPMHGSNAPCRRCKGKNGKGRCCNQEQGINDLDSMFTPRNAW
jgi:hypothetical protein